MQTLGFELTDETRALLELDQIFGIAQAVKFGIGATIAIPRLNSPTGKSTMGRIVEGIEEGLIGTDIELEVAEAIVKESSSGETIGKFVRRVARGLGGLGGVTIRAVKNKALWAKVIFLNIARAVDVGIEGGRREAEEGGDIPDLLAGTLIGFASAILFLDLVLPEGQNIAIRSPEGNLIIPGGLEGFATAQSLTAVLGEAIRLLAFTDITLPGPIGGGGGGGF